MDSKSKKAKILHHFLVKLRLQILFICSKTKPFMRWHDKNLVRDPILLYPVDSLAWKTLNEIHVRFAFKTRYEVSFGIFFFHHKFNKIFFVGDATKKTIQMVIRVASRDLCKYSKQTQIMSYNYHHNEVNNVLANFHGTWIRVRILGTIIGENKINNSEVFVMNTTFLM